MNKLGKRLEVIASLVDRKRIADVGCDHGKLAYYLLDNGISDYAVVSEWLVKSRDYNGVYILGL